MTREELVRVADLVKEESLLKDLVKRLPNFTNSKHLCIGQTHEHGYMTLLPISFEDFDRFVTDKLDKVTEEIDLILADRVVDQFLEDFKQQN